MVVAVMCVLSSLFCYNGSNSQREECSMEKRDLVDEYRIAMAEYLQWLGAASSHYAHVPQVSAVLTEMGQDEMLYKMMGQKGLYQYRVRMDEEIYREVRIRFADQWARLDAATRAAFSDEELAEWSKVAAELHACHEAMMKAADDWFFREGMRAAKPKGCLGVTAGAVMLPLLAAGWWFS